MQVILLIGIPASGKSSFYRERFYRTHVRLNLDMLKTRRREQLLMTACLEGKTPFVVDNTNLTREGRARYLAPAQAAKFAVHGYFFPSNASDAVARNAGRDQSERVPNVAIYAANRRLQPPMLDEGFDRLYRVQLSAQNQFIVEDCSSLGRD